MNPEELKRIYRDDISPDLFAGASSSPEPIMVFLGGQPGAGKSRATDALKGMHDREDLITIEGDAYRRHHPDYASTLQMAPTAMPQVTATAAGAWTGMAVDTAIAERYSALIEGTWRKVEVPLDTAQRVHDLGWKTHAAVVAVPAALSLTGTLARFYDDAPSRARWTPVAAHEQTVEALPSSVRKIAGAVEVDRFTMLDREGTIHMDEGDGDLSGRADRAASLYEQLTTRPLTEHELAVIAQTLTHAWECHQERTFTAQPAIDTWTRVAQVAHSLGEQAPGLEHLAVTITNAVDPQRLVEKTRLRPSLRDQLAARADQVREREQRRPVRPSDLPPRRGRRR